MKRQKGFTVMELLVVVSVIIIMATIMVAILNPKRLSDKGYDTQRKRDLGRIKLAFEEYFNDKECYPRQTDVESLVCDGQGFAPWLAPWPCDPGKESYKFQMGDDINCPRWFKVMTNLRNKDDKDIPSGWYSQPAGTVVGDGLTVDDVNYGVSSSNISWRE